MRRFRRSHRRQLLVVGIIVLLAALRWWSDWQRGGFSETSAASAELRSGTYQVQRVVDGDTIVLATRHIVRLQGVDTPETVKPDSPVEPWGPEASRLTKDFVQAAGGSVTVEIDGRRRDSYGRHLAFVWSKKRMLNEELVRAGLARVLLHYDFGQANKERLRRALKEAQRETRGIWSER